MLTTGSRLSHLLSREGHSTRNKTWADSGRSQNEMLQRLVDCVKARDLNNCSGCGTKFGTAIKMRVDPCDGGRLELQNLVTICAACETADERRPRAE